MEKWIKEWGIGVSFLQIWRLVIKTSEAPEPLICMDVCQKLNAFVNSVRSKLIQRGSSQEQLLIRESLSCGGTMLFYVIGRNICAWEVEGLET